MWHPQKSDIFALGKKWSYYLTFTRQIKVFLFYNFTNNFVLPSSLKGDENGTVALVDTKNPDSALSSTVHARSITGFAFSTHRYSLIYWHGTCDYIHLKALFVFRVKPMGVPVLVSLSRRSIANNRVNQATSHFWQVCEYTQEHLQYSELLTHALWGFF